MHRCIAICRTAIHVSIHVVPYRYVERFYSDSDSGFCVHYIRLSGLQNDIFKAHFIGLAKTLYPGVQSLGSMAKILPKVARFRLM